MSGRGAAENRQVEVSEISRGPQDPRPRAREPVVALSQLNRSLEMRADKRPMLADLRESRLIEQDADVVMFLYRDEMYNPDSPDIGTAEVSSRSTAAARPARRARVPQPVHALRQHGQGCVSGARSAAEAFDQRGELEQRVDRVEVVLGGFVG